MTAFRLLALVYALLALLIAPAWIAADEQPVPVPEGTVEEATEAVEPVLDATDGRASDGEEEDAAAAPAAEERSAEPAPEPADPAGVQQREQSEQVQPGAPRANAAQAGSVTITDFEFTPATITVNVGDTVTWTNQGPTVHTATAEDGSFDTGNLDRGESGSATFNEPGTIPYICTPHPFMQGRVVVRAAATESPGAGTTDADTGAATGSDVAGIADTGSGLPATGFEALVIALLGAATLTAGILLRRRTQP